MILTTLSSLAQSVLGFVIPNIGCWGAQLSEYLKNSVRVWLTSSWAAVLVFWPTPSPHKSLSLKEHFPTPTVCEYGYANLRVTRVSPTCLFISDMLYLCLCRLSRYEKTNEMLINFNLLSLSRYEATSQEFKKHTQVLYEMKKDLDNVFRRIRFVLIHMYVYLGISESFDRDSNFLI